MSTPQGDPFAHVKRKVAELQEALDEAATESEMKGGAHLKLCKCSKATHDACERAEKLVKVARLRSCTKHLDQVENVEEAEFKIQMELQERLWESRSNFQFLFLELENIVRLIEDGEREGRRVPHYNLRTYLQNTLKTYREKYEAVKAGKDEEELEQSIARIRTEQEAAKRALQ